MTPNTMLENDGGLLPNLPGYRAMFGDGTKDHFQSTGDAVAISVARSIGRDRGGLRKIWVNREPDGRVPLSVAHEDSWEMIWKQPSIATR